MEPRMTIITLGVNDLQRSYEFYHQGLGFPTKSKVEDGIIFFETNGTRLALYPFAKLAEDVNDHLPKERHGFSGITIAHNTKKRDEVDQILSLAESCGGKIEKHAQEVFWGGYSGYFSDPDGYLWEVAYADSFSFHEDDSLVL